jgi:hypothetical protein
VNRITATLNEKAAVQRDHSGIDERFGARGWHHHRVCKVGQARRKGGRDALPEGVRELPRLMDCLPNEKVLRVWSECC